MGRASLGIRRQVGWRTHPDRLAAVDAARGRMSRDLWLDRAVDLALRPVAQVQDPELKQDTHTCKHALLKGTKFENGVKYRVYGCSCGDTKEVPA